MNRKVRVFLPKLENIALTAYHPIVGRLRGLLLLVLLIVIAWTSYSLGKGKLSMPDVLAIGESSKLESEVRMAKQQISALRLEIEKLRRSAQVDYETAEQSQKILIDKEIQIQRQAQELAFYRKLLSPESVKLGVDIRDFSVRASVNPGEYYYDFLLMQSGGSKKPAKGKIGISIDGLQGDVMRRIDVASAKQDQLSYSFKYFQRLSGIFDLPSDFTPQKVSLVIAPSAKSLAQHKNSYVWQELINGSE
ncbi:MAG: hypothetical protein CBC79_00450 [Gammaproteobacteria bacterium TMED119]|nr:MAG: hypothetical protein CBC79_00450 [Gammaproteobacteria bacterium TMED119]